MVDGVYNNLISNYIPKNNTKFDIHKRSELRNIYNNIVKLSKESPLYLVKLSEDNQKFAITLKDDALFLRSRLASLNESNESSVFKAKQATSTDEDTVKASIVSEDYKKLPEPFSLKIDTLATPQVNEGIVLFGNGKAPSQGNYKFAIQSEGKNYEFQFHIGPNAINEEILAKISDAINKSDAGIHTALIRNSADNTIHMSLTSSITGKHLLPVFQLTDLQSPSHSTGLVEFYDLNRISRRAANAVLEINGEPRESQSNQFILNGSLRLDLTKAQKSPIWIDYQPDSTRIIKGIEELAESYNSLIKLAHENLGSQRYASRLLNELKGITHSYKNELESAGITYNQDGYMQIDPSLAHEAAVDGDLYKLFGSWTGISGKLASRMSMISIDPMDYIDKTLVTYPNTAKPGTANPYMTSIYSGLLYNSYC